MSPRILSCLALVLAACGPTQRERPDVLLISLDSVRADDLTFTDAERAPNLTALARRGTIFTQAIAGSSWTLPSHVELLSGQPPSVHRTESDDVAIDPATPLLAETLGQAGWFTAGIWSGWYLADEFGFARGFRVYQNAMTDGDRLQAEFRQKLAHETIDGAWRLQGEREHKSHQDVTSPRIVELASEVLDGLEPSEPLFLFTHFYDPHYDYVPPEPWASRFDPDYRGTIDGRDYWINPRVWDARRGVPTITKRDLRHVRALYRGEIGWCDQWIGELLSRFEAAGRLDDLWIFVTADHGEEFFEHGNRGHRQSLFDEVLRVPLLVVPPRGSRPHAPRSVAAQVSLADVAPTVLDVAGIEAGSSVLGRSLLPALEGQELESQPVVSSLQLMTSDTDGNWSILLGETLRTDDTKFLRITTVGRDHPARVEKLGLFDLATDPGEQHGLAGTPGEIGRDPRIRSAWQALESELAELRRRADELPRSDPSERTTDMARVLASELRGLGYVDVVDEPDRSPARLLPWGLGFRPPQPVEP